MGYAIDMACPGFIGCHYWIMLFWSLDRARKSQWGILPQPERFNQVMSCSCTQEIGALFCAGHWSC